MCLTNTASDLIDHVNQRVGCLCTALDGFSHILAVNLPHINRAIRFVQEDFVWTCNVFSSCTTSVTIRELNSVYKLALDDPRLDCVDNSLRQYLASCIQCGRSTVSK